MNDVAVERFYAVAVEYADGRQATLKVQGDSPADAFKAVRGQTQVRRVGKVTEISEAGFHSDHTPSLHTTTNQSGKGRPGQSAVEKRAATPRPSVRRESLIGFTIAGPRVVHESRKTAVEQPFKNLKAPPGSEDRGAPEPKLERKFFSPFNPVVQPKPLGPPIFAKLAAPSVETKEAATDVDEAGADAVPAEQSYRIIKSRRRDGHPYLLQRGVWQQLAGKKTFAVDWEKGFDDREKAEKHQGWVEEAARETAELDV